VVRAFYESPCFIHSTSGTIQISYSHVQKESLTSSDVFYTRQVLYPVLVTVYNTLECHGMDILPFSSAEAAQEIHGLDGPDDKERESWKRLLEGVREDGEWCLFTVDVRNTYGMPFEVTFERGQEGQYAHRNPIAFYSDNPAFPSDSCQVNNSPRGARVDLAVRSLSADSSMPLNCFLCSIILPVKRFLLPESQTDKPIPTLSDRQFVVSKSKLTKREEKHQKELFWYREELFKRVKGRWREVRLSTSACN
jgi:hypothetical protein